MEKESNFYDVVIIGGGPAAIAAAIYSKRANLKVVFIEKSAPGGKLVNTYSIENWIGDSFVEGYKLALRFLEHSEKLKIPLIYGEVINVLSHSEFKKEVIYKNNFIDGKQNISLFAKAVIIATGTTEKIPTQVKNIDTFTHFGVHYCAICDGTRYKDMDIAVIGGGQAAFEESIYLSSIAKHVYIFIRDPIRIRADKKAISDVFNNPKITVFQDGHILEIIGQKNKIEQIKVRIKSEEKKMNISAVFPYIGQTANTSFLKSLNITDEFGFIKVDEYMETKIKNIYAVGDVRDKKIRQITTAVADGTIAGKIIANRI